MNWPVFFTRLGSAIVFCIIMMFGILGGQLEYMLCLVFLIQFLCIKEFLKIVGLIFNAPIPNWMMVITQIMGVATIYGIWSFGFESLFLFLFPIILLLISVLSKKTYTVAGFACIIALFYISVPLAFLLAIWSISFVIPLVLILLIWTNDTMAYIVGSFIGKTPFSPISPKKTWEGTIGGVILTIVAATIWAKYDTYTPYQAIDWAVLAILASVMGTIGDLLESKLKRLAGVKDSGKIMPGHGGALDRFDSLLVTLPFAFCYISFYMTIA